MAAGRTRRDFLFASSASQLRRFAGERGKIETNHGLKAIGGRFVPAYPSLALPRGEMGTEGKFCISHTLFFFFFVCIAKSLRSAETHEDLAPPLSKKWEQKGLGASGGGHQKGKKRGKKNVERKRKRNEEK